MKTCVDKIVYPGKSLSLYKGKVVFSDEGLPGEILELIPKTKKKKFIEARVKQVLKPSSQRVKPKCDHYKTCSCYQYINYPYQLQLKQEQIKELFHRTLNIKIENIPLKESPQIWHYRNKIHLHLIWHDKKPSLAYHLPGSKENFQPVTECSLLSEQVNNLMGFLVKYLEKNNFPFIKEVIIKENRTQEQMYLTLIANNIRKLTGLTRFFNDLKKKFPLKGMALFVKEKNKLHYWGKEYIEEKMGGKILRYGPLSFFQVNPAILREMVKDIKKALNWQDYKNIIDLYCGIGALSIMLSKAGSHITGVEEDPNNITYLKENISLNQMDNFHIKKGKCKFWLPKLLNKPVDLIIIDPPRKGIGLQLCKQIFRKPPSVILYLSCNPTTATRDLAALLPKYKISSISIYDFFPQTPHIELLTVLKRK